MAVEEQVSSRLASLGQQAAADAARISIRVSGRLAQQLAEAGGWTIIKGADAVKDHIDSGRMTEGRLQRITGGDIHEIKLDPQSLRAVSQSLKQAGLDYAIEHDGPDHYLHFRGRDLDHIQHAVSRAFRSIGLTFDPETTAPGRNAPGEGADARHAREQGERHMPPSGAESTTTGPFTMVFNTVEWDPDAEIISNNLTQMNVPFDQSPGPGKDRQSFTFDSSYAPAVRAFIDAYAEKVEHFGTSRVDNYDQLCDPPTAARGEQNQSLPTETAAPLTTEQAPPKSDTPERPGLSQAGPMQSKEPAAPTRPAAEHADPVRSPVAAKGDKDKPGHGKKGRDDFLALLNKGADRKLEENRTAPKRVIEHRRGRS